MNKASAKEVKCLNTGEIYISASEAGRIKNIHKSSIMACCRGVRKSAGKDENNNSLCWVYI